MSLNSMTKKEILDVPEMEWNSKSVLCDSLVVVPSELNMFSVLKYKVLKWLSEKTDIFRTPEIYEIEGLHDSGYRIINYVAIVGNKPFCKFTGCSDDLCLDGIGGYGKNWINKPKEDHGKIDAAGWQVDCLRNSGLLRIHCQGKILCGENLSSFEIYFNKTE